MNLEKSITHLSFVVPVRNEAGNISRLVSEIQRVFENKITYEIIYVNDASTDETLEELKKEKEKYFLLRVISHDQRAGQSRALRTGIRAARYDWIATLDGDGQNNPEDLIKLIDAIDNDISLAIGNRRGSRRDPWIRKFSSKVANNVRSVILRDQTPDTGCGLKLFRKDLFLSLPYFDHMHRFLPALVQREGGRVISVPISHRSREIGRSNYGTLDRLIAGLIDLAGVYWLIRRSKNPNLKEL